MKKMGAQVRALREKEPGDDSSADEPPALAADARFAGLLSRERARSARFDSRQGQYSKKTCSR